MLRAKSLIVLSTIGSLAAVSSAADFTFLAPGFTQQVFGVSPPGFFFGGIAFGPNGVVWTDGCFFDGSPLYKLSTPTFTAHGTSTLHTFTPVPSNAGCGLTNDKLDGFIYSNTDLG